MIHVGPGIRLCCRVFLPTLDPMGVRATAILVEERVTSRAADFLQPDVQLNFTSHKRTLHGPERILQL